MLIFRPVQAESAPATSSTKVREPSAGYSENSVPFKKMNLDSVAYALSFALLYLLLMSLPIESVEIPVAGRIVLCVLFLAVHIVSIVFLLIRGRGRRRGATTLSLFAIFVVGMCTTDAVNPLLVVTGLTGEEVRSRFGEPYRIETVGGGQVTRFYNQGNPLNPGVPLSGPFFSISAPGGYTFEYLNASMHFDGHGKLDRWNYSLNLK